MLAGRGGARPGRSLGRRRTLAFAAAQIVFIWAIAAAIVVLTYREDIADAEARASRTSLTVATYTRQALTAADFVLKNVADWISQSDIASPEQFRSVMSQPRYAQELRDRIVGAPQINLAVVAASNGEVVNTTLGSSDWPRGIADREAFRALKEHSTLELEVTALARNPLGRWTFYMSRRIVARSGAMLGVIVVGIDGEYLSDLYGQMSPEGEDWITLFRQDGTLLAATIENRGLLGQRFPDALSLKMVRQGKSGVVGYTSQPRWSDPTDSEPLLVVPRSVDGFPVVVSAAVRQSVYLGGWDVEVGICLAVAAALTALTVLIARRFLRLLAQAEQAGSLKAERRLLATLIDTPSALCAVVDRAGKVIYANRSFDELLAGGTGAASIFDDAALKGGDEVVRFAASDERGPHEMDLRLTKPDGSVRFLHFSASHQSLPGLGNCAVLVGHDETQRHEAQQAMVQSAKLVTLGELTTGMAHELTQPLNVMRMAAQNALMEIDTAKRGDGPAAPDVTQEPGDAQFRGFMAAKINRILGQVDRAADIVSRMRIFGRAPQGPPSTFDARAACRSAVDLVRSRLATAGVKVREELGEERLMLMGHQNLLEQVLVSLLLNARDALDSVSRPDKTVEVVARRVPEGRICLTVADNGPGVPADIRDRIFEPFFTAKPPGKGTGLGLATSFGIVRDCGGELVLLPALQGAAFRVDLPAVG